jgi:hypothetical protein
MENLRHHLQSESVQQLQQLNKPVYLGRLLRQNSYLRFISGGSGYVLNRRALQILRESLHYDVCLSDAITSMEDLMVGHCLLHAGVLPLLSPEVPSSINIRPLSILNDSTSQTINIIEDIYSITKPYELWDEGMADVYRDRKLNYQIAVNDRGDILSEKLLSDISGQERSATLAYEDQTCVGYEHEDDCPDHNELFHPLNPTEVYHGNESWYQRMVYNHISGHCCCSEKSISFQNLKHSNHLMRCIYDYLHSDFDVA